MKPLSLCVAVFAALLLWVAGCTKSTTPNVYRHVPKVPTTPVAVGAIGAAAALTLANPDAAGKKKEDPTAPRNMKYKKTGEQVPSAVLDRLDSQKTDDDGDSRPDCAAAEPAGEGNELPPGLFDDLDKDDPIRQLPPDCVEAEPPADKPAKPSTEPSADDTTAPEQDGTQPAEVP